MLMKMQVPCTVIAPSLIPTKSGDHVKTDEKEAIKLARHHRAGELVSVFVPDETDEAVHDLCRARVDAIDDRCRAKTRLLAMLRRLGFNYSGKTTWNDAHKRYLRYLRDLSLPFLPIASSLRNSSARSTSSTHASHVTKTTWKVSMPNGAVNPSSMP